MAISGKERTAKYRAKKRESRTEAGHGIVQMTVFISEAHRALLRQAAERRGVTMQQMLEQIIQEAPQVRELEQDKDDFLSGRMNGDFEV